MHSFQLSSRSTLHHVCPTDNWSSPALFFSTPNFSFSSLALCWRIFGLAHTPRPLTSLWCKAWVHRTPLTHLVSLCRHNILIGALLAGHSEGDNKFNQNIFKMMLYEIFENTTSHISTSLYFWLNVLNSSNEFIFNSVRQSFLRPSRLPLTLVAKSYWS